MAVIPSNERLGLFTQSAQAAIEKHGIQDAQGFIQALMMVAGAESSFDAANLHDYEGGVPQGAGLFALHNRGYAGALSWEDRMDPAKNIAAAADKLGALWVDGDTLDANVKKMTGPGGQNPLHPDQLFANAMAYRGEVERAGMIEYEAGRVPLTGGYTGQMATTELEEPDIGDPKYRYTTEQIGPGGIYEGLGSVGGFNQYLFNTDWAAYASTKELMQGPPGEEGEDLGFYMGAVIDNMVTQIEGGQLEQTQANIELGRRLDVLSEGRQMYKDLLPYALPAGSEFLPGGGPGGVYEKLGLGQMPTDLKRVNPFAVAMQMMGETPEMSAIPDTSWETALGRAQELQGLAAPQEPVMAAVAAPTGQPTLADGVGAGAPVSVAGQPMGSANLDAVSGISPGPPATEPGRGFAPGTPGGPGGPEAQLEAPFGGSLFEGGTGEDKVEILKLIAQILGVTPGALGEKAGAAVEAGQNLGKLLGIGD